MSARTLTPLCIYLTLFALSSHTSDAADRGHNSTTVKQENHFCAPVTGNGTTFSCASLAGQVCTERELLNEFVLKTLNHCVIRAVCALGLCGNVLIFVVWSAESTFNPTIFFMKSLAVSDTVFLLWELIKYVPHDLSSGGQETRKLAVCFSRAMTAHTTLLLVFTRWVAVRKPMKAAKLLTRGRVMLSYAVAAGWCVVAAVLYILYRCYCRRVELFVSIYIVWLAFPTVVMVALNVSLVRAVCAHRSALADLGHLRHLGDGQSSGFHRMVAAVLSLSVTSLLANPTGAAVAVIDMEKSVAIEQWCGRNCNTMIIRIAILTNSFNSSINVVFYLLFISHFRRLLCRRFRCCRDRWRQPPQQPYTIPID